MTIYNGPQALPLNCFSVTFIAMFQLETQRGLKWSDRLVSLCKTSDSRFCATEDQPKTYDPSKLVGGMLLRVAAGQKTQPLYAKEAET